MASIRPVAISDLDLVCRHRLAMFRAVGRADSDLGVMIETFHYWLAPRLNAGVYFGFIAVEDGREIGGVGLMELDWPPHPVHPADARRGYVCNLFVEPEHRGRGIARSLMAASEDEFKRRGIPYAHVGLRFFAIERRLAELLARPIDLIAEPVEHPLLRANLERDRLRVF